MYQGFPIFVFYSISSPRPPKPFIKTLLLWVFLNTSHLTNHSPHVHHTFP